VSAQVGLFLASLILAVTVLGGVWGAVYLVVRILRD
jgi:hypothetical protein